MIPTGELSYDLIKSLYQQKGYPVIKDNELVNVFGYRSKDLVLDQFNDLIGVAYKDFFGNRQCLVFPATTKPGLHYLKNELGNAEGTFILEPGYYADCWTPGKHAGKYDALIQAGPKVFKGRRDKNADGKLDLSGPLYDDCAGLDLHTTRFDINVNNVVDRFSAGCQVLFEDKHFLVLYNLIMRALEVSKGKTIGYALFQEA